jgi:hypothetical protein
MGLDPSYPVPLPLAGASDVFLLFLLRFDSTSIPAE